MKGSFISFLSPLLAFFRELSNGVSVTSYGVYTLFFFFFITFAFQPNPCKRGLYISDVLDEPWSQLPSLPPVYVAASRLRHEPSKNLSLATATIRGNKQVFTNTWYAEVSVGHTPPQIRNLPGIQYTSASTYFIKNISKTSAVTSTNFRSIQVLHLCKLRCW